MQFSRVYFVGKRVKPYKLARLLELMLRQWVDGAKVYAFTPCCDVFAAIAGAFDKAAAFGGVRLVKSDECVTGLNLEIYLLGDVEVVTTEIADGEVRNNVHEIMLRLADECTAFDAGVYKLSHSGGIIAGAAGCGKTYALCANVQYVLRGNPRAQVFLPRHVKQLLQQYYAELYRLTGDSAHYDALRNVCTAQSGFARDYVAACLKNKPRPHNDPKAEEILHNAIDNAVRDWVRQNDFALEYQTLFEFAAELFCTAEKPECEQMLDDTVQDAMAKIMPRVFADAHAQAKREGFTFEFMTNIAVADGDVQSCGITHVFVDEAIDEETYAALQKCCDATGAALTITLDPNTIHVADAPIILRKSHVSASGLFTKYKPLLDKWKSEGAIKLAPECSAIEGDSADKLLYREKPRDMRQSIAKLLKRLDKRAQDEGERYAVLAFTNDELLALIDIAYDLELNAQCDIDIFGGGRKAITDLIKLMGAMTHPRSNKFLYNLYTTCYSVKPMPKEDILRLHENQALLGEYFQMRNDIPEFTRAMSKLPYARPLRLLSDIVSKCKPWKVFAADSVNAHRSAHRGYFYKSALLQFMGKLALCEEKASLDLLEIEQMARRELDGLPLRYALPDSCCGLITTPDCNLQQFDSVFMPYAPRSENGRVILYNALLRTKSRFLWLENGELSSIMGEV